MNLKRRFMKPFLQPQSIFCWNLFFHLFFSCNYLNIFGRVKIKYSPRYKTLSIKNQIFHQQFGGLIYFSCLDTLIFKVENFLRHLLTTHSGTTIVYQGVGYWD
jgi:hypothetical protein